MTPLPKTMAKFGPLRNQTNYISLNESCPKMYFLLNLNHFVKGHGHLSQIWHFFRCPLTKYGHVT